MDSSTARFEFQRQQFSQALAALREALDTDTGDKKSRDSILLSYVFTFEVAWKSLRAALVLRGERPADYAAAVLKAAFAAALITEPDLWMDLREARNEVSHAFEQEKAIMLPAMLHNRAAAGFGQLLARLQAHDD